MNNYFLTPDFSKNLPLAVKGEGVYLFDDRGQKYLDGSSGSITVNLGHSNREIIEPIKKQLDILSFTHRAQFSNKPMLKLAEKIVFMAGNPYTHTHFVNSGSEANEMALKLARLYWLDKAMTGKTRVISRSTSYHGSTTSSLSLSGIPRRRQPFYPYLELYPALPIPYCFRCPYEKTYPSCQLKCAWELDNIIDTLGEENVSAFIAEPITGASGAAITPPPDYFSVIQNICRKNNILFIMDEVITGFGRTGKEFAFQHWGIEPDIITFGKGASAGYTPLAGIIINQHIYNTIKQNSGKLKTGHTFGGNPLSCAAGLSVLNYISSNNMVAVAVEKGAKLKNMLEKVADQSAIVGDVRGKGLLLGVELVKDKDKNTCFPPDINAAGKLVDTALAKGLVLYPSRGMINGVAGDAVLVAPPFIIKDQELEELCQLLKVSLEFLQKDIL